MKEQQELSTSQTIIWNPWHGCKRCSTGCDHCYLFEKDYLRGYKHSDEIKFNKSQFYLPTRKTRQLNKATGKNEMIYKIPSGSTIVVCNTSDFFIEEADYYRKRAWKIIQERKDCLFSITTKRLHRFYINFPDSLINNIMLNVSIENQITADLRIPLLLSIPCKYKGIEISPILENINIEKYLSTGKIDRVIVRGETSRHSKVRTCIYENVLNIKKQCELYDITFIFERTGSKLFKDNELIKVNGEQNEKDLANHYNINNINQSFDWCLEQEELEQLERIEKASEIYSLVSKKNKSNISRKQG